MIRKFIAMTVAATFATAGTLTAQMAGQAEPTSDIVDVAAEAGSFTTLLAAAKAAGLVEALKSEGPMTVFAPTDEAFANLPAGTVESLLLPENKDKLTAILLYHVVEGKVTSDKVVNLDSAPTLQGQSVKITVKAGDVYINDAKVLKADIGASNGVIHVVDKVILPTLN